MAGVSQHGSDWGKIASLLPGRSADAVRNRWFRLAKEQSGADHPGRRTDATDAPGATDDMPDAPPDALPPDATDDRSTDDRSTDDRSTDDRSTNDLSWSAQEDGAIGELVQVHGATAG